MNVINGFQLLLQQKKQYEKIEDGLLYGKAGQLLYYARLSSIHKVYNSTYNKLSDVLKKC